VADVESKLRRDITPASDADPLFGPGASRVMRYLASIAMTGLATVVAVGVDSKLTIPNLSLVFVVPVIIAGVSLGLGPSLCSAILGALAFNFFLTEPRYSLAVDDPANIWAIGLLFVVGLIVSGVAFTSHQRAAEAALLRRQATVLQGFSRDLVAADDMKAIVSITSQALAALFQVPAVVMLVTEDRVEGENAVIDWHSTRTNVLRRRIRWSTSLRVFWPWCWTVNMHGLDAPLNKFGGEPVMSVVAAQLCRSGRQQLISVLSRPRSALCLPRS
jgi:K+-sensing histidine kinase KdpD